MADLELRPAVFLDRDGTISRSPAFGEYILDAGEIELLAGVKEALGLFEQAGFLRVVVSNQRGVALGLMGVEDLAAIDRRLAELLVPQSSIDAFYYCTHSLDDGCGCRKPAPGLILNATRELGLDLSRSWMVGDSEIDIEAGRRAGVRTVKVEPLDGALLQAAHQIVQAAG